MSKSLRIAALSWSFFLGCDVRVDEIAGTWRVTDTARRYLSRESPGLRATIVLEPGGAFTASDVPGLISDDPSRLERGSGTWKLLPIGAGDTRVQLEFRELDGRKDPQVSQGAQLFISTGIGERHLYYYLGDPDEGRWIEFEKQ